MTLRDLIRPAGKFQPTESQYELLQRADRILPCGRYFGGQLSAEQVEALTHGVELRKGTVPNADQA